MLCKVEIKNQMDSKKCKIISLPKVEDLRGSLTFIERNHLPFESKRIFYIYDIPTGKSRGAHAHKKCKQFMICLSGSFDVEVDDGVIRKTFHLNRPWEGLYVPPMVWAAETNFDPGSLCLVLCSDFYDEDDYIRDYNDFIKYKNDTL